jgi:hypothetical protein
LTTRRLATKRIEDRLAGRPRQVAAEDIEKAKAKGNGVEETLASRNRSAFCGQA